jgi:hypothetical protein
MEISISAKKKKDYLLIVSKGRLSVAADLLAHATMMYREIIKYDLDKVLLELTGTVLPQSLFAYYDLVNFYVANLPAKLRSLKMAVIVKELIKKWRNFGKPSVPTKDSGSKVLSAYKQQQAGW